MLREVTALTGAVLPVTAVVNEAPPKKAVITPNRPSADMGARLL